MVSVPWTLRGAKCPQYGPSDTLINLKKNHRIAIVHFSVFVLKNVEKLNLPQLQENQIEAIEMKPVAQLSCHQVD